MFKSIKRIIKKSLNIKLNLLKRTVMDNNIKSIFTGQNPPNKEFTKLGKQNQILKGISSMSLQLHLHVTVRIEYSLYLL